MNQDNSDDRGQQQTKQTEKERIRNRKAISAKVVHEAVRIEGEEELERPPRALAWSGLAAGLSMGFSLVGEGLIYAYMPAVAWRPLVVSFGYSIGFIIVILGRQQLFTENPLTTMLPFLHEPDLHKLLKVLRLWGIVLAANLVGVVLFALFVGETSVFDHHIHRAFIDVSRSESYGGFWPVLLRGIFAGWLVALVVWLLPAAQGGAEIWVILILTYTIGLGHFAHVIAGSTRIIYLVTADLVSWWTYVIDYFLPSLIGNIIGGVSLVAALNHAQVVAGQSEDQPDEDSS